MMENAFIINGGSQLKGEVVLSGAKNVALKIIIASLLFDSKVELHNIPDLKDIRELIALLEQLGLRIDFHDNIFTVEPNTLKDYKVDLLHGSKTRVSFMLFAPFMHRFGKAYIPNPGGCRIGARPINRQIDLLEAFGVKTSYDSETGYYDATMEGEKLPGTTYEFSKKSHTGTELAILLAVKAKGQSVIQNAALEPEIDDLIQFLNESGAHILREGESIVVEGVDYLRQTEKFAIMFDRNELVTFASLGLSTQSDIFLRHAKPDTLKFFLDLIEKIRGGYQIEADGIRFFYKQPLQAIDITTMPEPGFMTDWQGPWAVMMTQAEGISHIHETVYENRFGYVKELKKLGAKIEFEDMKIQNPMDVYQFDLANPEKHDFSKQAIRINGKNKLHGGVMSVTDMRAGATLIIGACIAKGESVINGASEVDRGYEYIDRKLIKLGVDIKRV